MSKHSAVDPKASKSRLDCTGCTGPSAHVTILEADKGFSMASDLPVYSTNCSGILDSGVSQGQAGRGAGLLVVFAHIPGTCLLSPLAMYHICIYIQIIHKKFLWANRLGLSFSLGGVTAVSYYRRLILSPSFLAFVWPN